MRASRVRACVCAAAMATPCRAPMFRSIVTCAARNDTVLNVSTLFSGSAHCADRDFVVDAMNRDMPFDEFLKKQLAGDLLDAETEDQAARNLIATGYLAIGTKGHNQQGEAQFRLDLIDEQIDAITRGDRRVHDAGVVRLVADLRVDLRCMRDVRV